MREVIEWLTLNLSSISQVSAIVMAILTLLLTFIAVKFTTKPNIKIIPNEKHTYWESESVVLSFQLRNVGHWYGRPPASKLIAYVNTAEDFEPKSLRFGSTLETERTIVERGKGNSKYLKAEGMDLFYGEPAECIELDVTMPAKAGKYLIWIALRTQEGGYAFYEDKVKVRSKPKGNCGNSGKNPVASQPASIVE